MRPRRPLLSAAGVAVIALAGWRIEYAQPVPWSAEVTPYGAPTVRDGDVTIPARRTVLLDVLTSGPGPHGANVFDLCAAGART